MNTQELTNTLESLLPVEMKRFASKIAVFIQEIWNTQNTTSKSTITNVNDDDLVKSLKYLSGKEVSVSKSTISFGSEGQFGDIRFGDIISGNTVYISLYFDTKTPSANRSSERAILYQSAIDVFTKYEVAIKSLLQLLSQNKEQQLAILTFEQRLQENLRRARLFGDTPSLQSDRSEIIYGLNSIALRHIGKSFNEIMEL